MESDLDFFSLFWPYTMDTPETVTRVILPLQEHFIKLADFGSMDPFKPA